MSSAVPCVAGGAAYDQDSRSIDGARADARATVARRLALREYAQEPLADIADRLLAGLPRPLARASRLPTSPARRAPLVAPADRHAVDVLGEGITAAALGPLFAAVVDCFADLDAGVLERLAFDKARTADSWQHRLRTRTALIVATFQLFGPGLAGG